MVAISKDVRRIYEELYAQVSLLTYNWLTYKDLFYQGQKRIDLLDRTGRVFFQVYHDMLLGEVMLSLSRLTDKPKSKKGARISIRRLLLHLDGDVDPSFAPRFKAMVEQAERDCLPFRHHRDNEIAHINLEAVLNSHLHPLPDLTIEQIDGALKNIQASLTLFSESVFDETHVFEPIQAVRGPASLIFYLERGVRCVDEDHEHHALH